MNEGLLEIGGEGVLIDFFKQHKSFLITFIKSHKYYFKIKKALFFSNCIII